MVRPPDFHHICFITCAPYGPIYLSSPLPCRAPASNPRTLEIATVVWYWCLYSQARSSYITLHATVTFEGNANVRSVENSRVDVRLSYGNRTPHSARCLVYGDRKVLSHVIVFSIRLHHIILCSCQCFPLFSGSKKLYLLTSNIRCIICCKTPSMIMPSAR